MGRDVKRVPLDFDHPLETVWPGYVCDVGRNCSVCHGRGTTTARDRLADLVSFLMLSGDDARRGRCHPYFFDIPLHTTTGMTPSKDMVELTAGLAGREMSFLGHDAIDDYSAMKKIMATAGLPATWGQCQACSGTGEDPATRAASEAWRPTEPPKGPGWQMWETVSEGSPISPVFATAEALGQWCADNNGGSWRRPGPSYETWMGMILGPGWAPSAVVVDGEVLGGVEGVGGHA